MNKFFKSLLKCSIKTNLISSTVLSESENFPEVRTQKGSQI